MKLVNKTINCIKNMKTYEILLVILMVLYLVTGVSTPYALAPYVNNMFMNASLIALVIVLYLYGNPLLALFVAIVSFVFINRSKKVDPIVMKPSEDNKDTAMDKLNTHLIIYKKHIDTVTKCKSCEEITLILDEEFIENYLKSYS